MTPEHTAANIESWANICQFIDRFPDSQWADWKRLARRFIQYGLDRNFNRHFRAGQSLSTFVFSTLDRHGLQYEPHVSLSLHPPETLKLAYRPATPAQMGDKPLEYELGFDDAMPTFQRFLNHLWETTMAEPLPSDMRSPEHTFNAPILPLNQAKAEPGPPGQAASREC